MLRHGRQIQAIKIGFIGRRQVVETLFGKMVRTLLRHIRVQSPDELKARILKGIAEINAAPVVHRWKNFKALEQESSVYVLLKRYN
jgi:hypothetical protein